MSELELKKDNLSEEDILKAQKRAKEAAVYLVKTASGELDDMRSHYRVKSKEYSDPLVSSSRSKIGNNDSLKSNYEEKSTPTRHSTMETSVVELMHKPKRTRLSLSPKEKVSSTRLRRHVYNDGTRWPYVKDESISVVDVINNGDTQLKRVVRLPQPGQQGGGAREGVVVEQITYRRGKIVRSKMWESNPGKITDQATAKEAETAERIASSILGRTFQAEKASRVGRSKGNQAPEIIERRIKRAEQIAHAKRVSEKLKRK